MSNNEFLCFFRKSSIAFCASGLLAKGLLNDFFISASIVFLSFSMFFITLFSGSLPLITINRSIFPCTGFIKLCALYLAALLDFSFSQQIPISCLLYTSDAADEEDSVDLGGRRIIKKKNK